MRLESLKNDGRSGSWLSCGFRSIGGASKANPLSCPNKGGVACIKKKVVETGPKTAREVSAPASTANGELNDGGGGEDKDDNDNDEKKLLPVNRHSTSQFWGVTAYRNGMFRSRISSGGAVHLGMHRSEEGAARARDLGVLALGLDQCKLNFPRDDYTESEVDCMKAYLRMNGYKVDGHAPFVKAGRLSNTKVKIVSRCADSDKGYSIEVETGAWQPRYRGVTVDIRRRQFRAEICMNGERYYLGLFHDEKSAARAYDLAALVLPREYSLNFDRTAYSETETDAMRRFLSKRCKAMGATAYHGVRREGTNYVVDVCLKDETFRIGVYHSIEYAAREFDLAVLALVGDESDQMNFPADSYTEREIETMRRVLEKRFKHWPGRLSELRTKFNAAHVLSPAIATPSEFFLDDFFSRGKWKGISHDDEKGAWRVEVMYWSDRATTRAVCVGHFMNEEIAAQAYDLSLIAIKGQVSDRELNFAQSTYSWERVQEMAKHVANVMGREDMPTKPKYQEPDTVRSLVNLAVGTDIGTPPNPQRNVGSASNASGMERSTDCTAVKQEQMDSGVFLSFNDIDQTGENVGGAIQSIPRVSIKGEEGEEGIVGPIVSSGWKKLPFPDLRSDIMAGRSKLLHRVLKVEPSGVSSMCGGVTDGDDDGRGLPGFEIHSQHIDGARPIRSLDGGDIQ